LKNDNITKKIIFEPKGIVLALLPWDFPILEIINVIVPSILAGNSVLLKDNTECPIFSIIFEESVKDIAPNLIQKFFMNPMEVH